MLLSLSLYTAILFLQYNICFTNNNGNRLLGMIMAVLLDWYDVTTMAQQHGVHSSMKTELIALTHALAVRKTWKSLSNDKTGWSASLERNFWRATPLTRRNSGLNLSSLLNVCFSGRGFQYTNTNKHKTNT